MAGRASGHGDERRPEEHDPDVDPADPREEIARRLEANGEAAGELLLA